MEQMPMWCPPTPPTTDNDVYIDYSLGFLYENTPMSEAQLPPIYIKKERKRCRVDVGISEDGCRPSKIRHKDDSMHPPKSLFERPLPMLMKIRREMKMHKYRTMMRPPVPMLGVKTPSSSKACESDQPVEWMINEEWLLLQAIQVYQAQPVNLIMVSPSYVPNWDLVSDIVNNGSRLFRSFKQCRMRYEAVVEPREEGKLLYDTTPKKQKKQKGSVYKTPQVTEQQSKGNRPLRTSQLQNQDKNQSFTQMNIQKFEILKNVSNKRTPTVKPMVVTPSMKNPNNAAVLADYGIQYDNPKTCEEVAQNRIDRLNKEKLKQAVLDPSERMQHVAARLLQQQQMHQLKLQQQQQQQQTQQQTAQQVVSSSAGSATSQVHQLVQSTITAVANTGGVTKVANSNATSNNVATGSNPVATTVKARPGTAGGGQQSIQDTRTTSAVAVASVGNVQTAQRIATASLVSAGQSSAATATAAAQKGLVGVTLTATPGTKTMTTVQLQYYRQQQMLMRQQHLKMREGMNVSGNTSMASVLHTQGGSGQKVSVAVSATAAQQRAAAATLMKQGIAVGGSVAQTAVGKQAVARTVSETEMAALIKRQALQQQAKAAAAAAAAVAQVPAQTGLSPAHIFAQAGLQVQQAGTSTSGTPVATLVKTANVAGVRTASQQIRQLALHPQLLAQRKLPAQKVAQLAQVTSKSGVQTQLIVQQKSLAAAMTVQQIQQVMKHVQPSTMQQFAHVSTGQTVSQASQVVLAKSPLQTRVIPVASGALKQTIQVVTAGNAQLRQATPIQGKPMTSSTVRRSPGPGPSPGQSPIPSSSTTGTAASSGSTNSPGTSSASTSNMSSTASALGQVRLQGITHSQQQPQQQQQQQQQAQQDTQPK